MNTKLHAIADANGRLLSFFITSGQVKDYTGTAALRNNIPKVQRLLGDRGYDADWFRDVLQEKGSSRASRAGVYATSPLSMTSALPAPQPHRDHVRPPRGLATRRNLLRFIFFCAVALAANVIFWP